MNKDDRALITVRFGSPSYNPHKLPRPLYIEVNTDTFAFTMRGGEFGAGQLIGLGRGLDAADDFNDPEQWCGVADIVADAVDKSAQLTSTPTALVPVTVGWFPAVIDPYGIYTATYPVTAVEATK